MIVEGVLINLLNPKLTIFFFAFLPVFVQPDSPDAVPQMLLLSGIFMAVTLVVFALYGVFAAALRAARAAAPARRHLDAPLLRGRLRPARGPPRPARALDD